MVHFTWLQIGGFILVSLAVIWAIVWAIGRIAKAVPPALTKPGYKSGIGGLLLWVVVFSWILAVTPLFRLGRDSAEVVRVMMLDASYAGSVLGTLVPDLLSAPFLTVTAFMLTVGRSAKALYTALVLAWLGGPIVALLRMYFLNTPFKIDSEPNAFFVAMIVGTIYLLFADRSALTYGLPRAEYLPEREGAH